MLNLPTVTLSCFATTAHADAAHAFEYSKRGITFRNHLVITDKPEFFVTDDGKTDVVIVPPLKDYAEGSILHCTNSWNLVSGHMGSHILSVQWDGFVLFPEKWEDEWLSYGIVASPMFDWCVGNHGFCLLGEEYFTALKALNLPPTLEECYPCDQVICIRHGERMRELGCRFPTNEVARRFSRENIPPVESFGFHGKLSLQWVKDNGLYE